MKKIITLFSIAIATSLCAQKVKTDMESMWCEALPKNPLPADKQTFSCVTKDDPANAKMDRTSDGMQSSNLGGMTTKLITGLKNVAAGTNPGVAVTIITEPFYVTGKTVQQGAPVLVNGNSVPSYYYSIATSYKFRAIAVNYKGDTVLDIRQGLVPQINYPQDVSILGGPTSFTSKVAVENEYRKSEKDLNVLVKKKAGEAIVKYLSDTLNPMFGYTAIQMFFPLSYAKGKSHNYSDLDSALDFMKTAMDSVTKRTRKDSHVNWNFESAQKNVSSAVAIWERALKQESAEKDARIHAELAACLRLNLAMGYMMLNDYAKSETLFNQCINDPNLGKAEKRNAEHLNKNFLPLFSARHSSAK
jgi:hypothetical protein